MAGSFFRGTDAELYNGSNNFAAMIATDFALYGLTSGQKTDYQTKNTSYATAYEATLTPSTRTKGATAAKNAAKIILKLVASDLAKIIEGQSNVTDQQKIDLGLNVRQTPSPVGPPGQPTDLGVRLTSIGELDMKWKCANPPGCNGVTYNVFRYSGGGVPAPADYAYIGGTGVREFKDQTVPAGAALIMYKIQGVRSTAAGEWGTFNIFMGVNSSGGAEITKVVSTSKIAA